MTENLSPLAKRRLDRRRLLELGAAGLGATILSACGPPSVSSPTAAPTTAPAAPAAAAPTAAAAGAAATTTTAPAAAAAPTATTAAAAAPAANTGATVSQPVTIVFNTWWQPLQDVFVVLTKNFQDANPGVTVKTQFGGDDYTTKMEAGIVAGGFGDAATGDNGVQTKYMSAGHHYELTDLAKQDNLDLRGRYALGGIEIWGGKVLQLPMDNDDRAVYYNKTMLKEAGQKDPWDDLHGDWTLDDMHAMAKAVTKPGAGGKVGQYGFQVAIDDTEDNEPYIWSMGGNYANWDTGKYNYLDPGVVKWFETLYQWAVKDKILITPDVIQSLQSGSANVNPFRAGLVAFYHRASYDSTINEKEIGSKFEWDAAPSPKPGSYNTALPSGVAGSTVNPNFVPKIAANPALGYKWIAYLCSDVAENLYAQKKTMFIANKAAWKTYQDTAPPKHAGSFAYYAFSRPYGYHYYSDIMNEVMYDTVQPELDKAFLGKQTIQQALTNAQKKIDTLGRSQSCPWSDSPYTIGGSPLPALSDTELAKWGVHPYTS